MKKGWFIAAALGLFLVWGCQQKAEEISIDGHWRAVWMSQGGEVPVDFYFQTSEDGILEGEIRNAEEVLPFSRIDRSGSHINIYNDEFESRISADISDDGSTMSGSWAKRAGAPVGLPFNAYKGDFERFPVEKYPSPEEEAPIQDISGTWKYVWKDGDPDDYLVMTCRQEGEKVSANIRSAIGDMRWLDGVYRNGRLWLSLFNGTWVFLFQAVMDDNGVFHGTWVKSANPPYEWTATKEAIDLTDPFTITRLSNDERLFRFEFSLADSPEKTVSQDDPMFSGSPLIIALTTTGCPNGHDNAGLLSKIYADYREKGLKMLMVHYEFVDDIDLIRERVARFRSLYEIDCPAAYSLTKNKAESGLELPDLERFVAYPTTIFMGSDGKVTAIHTGMEGPATGEHYVRLEQRYRDIVESLLENRRPE